MGTKKNYKSHKHRKTRGGGIFSSTNAVKPYPGECDVNRLTILKTSNDMHTNYQKCCPKSMFGTKNSSPYCKQLDLNFQSAMAGENNDNEYHGYNPNEIYNMRQNPPTVPAAQLPQQQYNVAAAQKKPWYKFWGGRKSRRNRSNRKRKYSRKHRK